MFTGIIEEVGKIANISKQGQSMIVAIQARKVLEDVHIGDSISVNGVCLTVTTWNEHEFQVDVMPETFRKSNLHQLAHADAVNLERAMIVGSRFGGHIVQGHVDGTGVIAHRRQEENAVVFHVRLHSSELSKYMIPKGSIAMDGISLTVVDADRESFIVSIIPHTLAQTALKHKKVGDTVNLETDMIGKYVEHLLTYAKDDANSSMINQDFLIANGFA